ncbi:MAG: hypothetical protein HRJ53_19650 [Acidobacteria bacterium Pan2503]|uniref:Uncharacterized protein n=1 Tax=Candidatus Acidiferrum panamense TaxID=2741543 RepID=A0A7V8NTE9_9BACT|nr:hypothetical protein [Candidatus Acidoferrum panamensis]
MSWTIPGAEKRFPAREYVEHVNRIGGFNRYGEPNFRLVWGQNEVDLVYGVGPDGRKGQHFIPKHGNIPAWFIDCWKPPEIISPEVWYAITWDWEADAPGIGKYPERGMYVPAPFNLFVRSFNGDRMTIDAMPLTHWVIDLFVPNLLKEQESTYFQRKTAIEQRIAAERDRAARQAYDVYINAGLAFAGRAGTHESNHERWEQRIREKQAGMRISRDEIVRRKGLGHRVVL